MTPLETILVCALVIALYALWGAVAFMRLYRKDAAFYKEMWLGERQMSTDIIRALNRRETTQDARRMNMSIRTPITITIPADEAAQLASMLVPFKKHRGKELWEVLEKDLDYVRYLVEELNVQLDDEAFAEYQKRMRK